MRLSEKVAVITGGASGIGRATAIAFAREGADVVVADRDFGEEEAAADLDGHQSRAVQTDVSRESDIERLFETVSDEFGGVDVLVNNAGVNMPGGIEEVTPQQFDDAFASNVRGAYLASRRAVPMMRERGGGVILMTASNAGLVARSHDPIYCASKAALIMLARSLALGLAKDRIRVNAICPGPVDTPMMWSSFAGLSREAVKSQVLMSVPLGSALGRVAAPEEVALAAVYLASDEAMYITGIALPVDGGKTAGLQVAS